MTFLACNGICIVKIIFSNQVYYTAFMVLMLLRCIRFRVNKPKVYDQFVLELELIFMAAYQF